MLWKKHAIGRQSRGMRRCEVDVVSTPDRRLVTGLGVELIDHFGASHQYVERHFRRVDFQGAVSKDIAYSEQRIKPINRTHLGCQHPVLPGQPKEAAQARNLLRRSKQPEFERQLQRSKCLKLADYQ